MTRFKSIHAALIFALALSSCATTNEMTLAPNMVRLDTQASGLIFTSAAGAITMKRAAEVTLSRGYTHFRLEQATTSSGSRISGVYADTTAWGSSTIRGNSVSSNFGGTTVYTPVRAPTASIGVTVVMYRANDAAAKGAFDAQDVVKKNGKV